MYEQEQKQRPDVELKLGDSIINGMREALSTLNKKESVTIKDGDHSVSFSQLDAESWLEALLSRGGKAKLYTPQLGEHVPTSFVYARRKDPSIALHVVAVDASPDASHHKILAQAADALYKAGTVYPEGNAVTINLGGDESFYLTDIDVVKKYRELFGLEPLSL